MIHRKIIKPVFFSFLLPFVLSGQQKDIAFPGAQGWAAYTSGGRGGEIIRVTTLSSTGKGSITRAVEEAGPRIIVFEVGGVIDLKKNKLVIKNSMVTIAGQTAPSPGITFIRGTIEIRTNNVIIQHIMVRTGEAGCTKEGGWEPDCISVKGSHANNVIIDHCSFSWGVDENISASGPRFNGDNPEEWRQGTSHCITISNCIIAEGLSNSIHRKGEHSKGALVHDNVTEIAIMRNLFAHNTKRNPLFKGGTTGVIINNYIYNPGNRAIHYALKADEWEDNPYQEGNLSIVGNVFKYGPDTKDSVSMVTVNYDGPCNVYLHDNYAFNQEKKNVEIITGNQYLLLDSAVIWPPVLNIIPADNVLDDLIKNVGARPWERDEVDTRIINSVLDRTGKIINNELEAGGYPKIKKTYVPFNPDDWDLHYMIRKNEK